MRTTVTLDDDVVKMLREAMRCTQQSFKQTLNKALRDGLAQPPMKKSPVLFKVKARDLGLKPGLDPAEFNQLL